MKKYYIGLGDSGYLLSKKISEVNKESQYKALDVWSSRRDENLINLNRSKKFDYYLANQDFVDAHKWLKVIPYHNMRSHPYELSRAEIRLIYEIELKYFRESHNRWLKTPMEQLDNDSEIHIIIPMHDNIATSLGILIAWDIKRNLQMNQLNTRIIADLILPDSLLFPVHSKVEMDYYYSISTAFVKELILLIDIYNGNIEHKKINISFGERFDEPNRILPYDVVSTHGTVEMAALEEGCPNRTSYHDMLNSLTESILNNRNTFCCSNVDFEREFLEPNRLFNTNGHAYKSYIEYQKSLNPLINNMLHLDFRWDKLFYTK